MSDFITLLHHSPEQEKESHEEGSEVIVSIYFCRRIKFNVSKNLQ